MQSLSTSRRLVRIILPLCRCRSNGYQKSLVDIRRYSRTCAPPRHRQLSAAPCLPRITDILCRHRNHCAHDNGLAGLYNNVQLFVTVLTNDGSSYRRCSYNTRLQRRQPLRRRRMTHSCGRLLLLYIIMRVSALVKIVRRTACVKTATRHQPS